MPMPRYSNEHDLRYVEQIWRAGVDRVDGQKATREALEADQEGPWKYVLAVGKGAGAMLQGALDSLTSDARALLVTKYHHVDQVLSEDSRIEIIESGHPMPDQNSIKAGVAVRRFVQNVPLEAPLLFLVSGGASALVESLVDGLDLSELQELNAELLADGYSIDRINLIRIAISNIKGGKLLNKFSGRLVRVYGLSDIPGDNADLIGSGIAAIRPPSVASFEIPASIQQLIDRAKGPQNNEHDFLPTFDYRSRLIGSNALARQSAAEKAESMNIPVIEQCEILQGDILDLAPKLANRVANGGYGVYIWGGEPTVMLPEHPGSGGRNQSLAVALAIEIADQAGVSGLVAGTDGSDGPTDAAGGFFYSGMSITGAQDALTRADAGTWLSGAEKLFVTGPTGTNVMDLAVVLRHE